MSRRYLFQCVAAKFRMSGEPEVKVEEILQECADEGVPLAWEISRLELANGLSERGLILQNGVLSEATDARSIHPQSSGYAEFQTAAKRALRWRDAPIEAIDLVDVTGLAGEKIPWSGMREVLERCGLHFLPGLGYWKHPIYSDPFLRSVVVAKSPKRIGAVVPLFQQYGWPIAGRDLAGWSKNVLQARSVASEASRGNMFVRGLKMGLYVPADRPGDLPMSVNVADRMLDYGPDEWIRSDHDLRSFRIAHLMARGGMGSIKIGRVAGLDRRPQRLLFEPTREGLRKLLRAARRPAEVF